MEEGTSAANGCGLAILRAGGIDAPISRICILLNHIQGAETMPLRKLALICFGFTLALGCGGGTSITRTENAPTLSVALQSAAVPANGTLTITATTSGAVAPPTWSFQYLYGGPPNPGSLSSSSGTTIVYTAPPTPPLYGPHASSDVQGKVYLQGDVAGLFGAANANLTLTITAASVTTGISPTAVTLPLGSTALFTGYAVGSTNNGVTYQVNGVTNGSAVTGYISNDASSAGTYAAPATMPMSGNTVTITMVSQADPSKSSSAIVTLQ